MGPSGDGGFEFRFNGAEFEIQIHRLETAQLTVCYGLMGADEADSFAHTSRFDFIPQIK